MSVETSERVANILLENLKEALRAVDLSIAVAFTCVAFLLMHGLQGDFAREVNREQTRPTQNQTAADGPANARAGSEEQDTTIPLFGFTGKLLTASIAALALYWVFCLRAAFRCSRVTLIARRLGAIDPGMMDAALLLPSLATASKPARGLACVALGGLGLLAYLVMYAPLYPIRDLLMSSVVAIVLPACVLGWNIWNVPSSIQNTDSGA
jgi:hypothetical protein